MEYLRDRGEYADLPLDEIRDTFASYYSKLTSAERGDFDREVEEENRPSPRGASLPDTGE